MFGFVHGLLTKQTNANILIDKPTSISKLLVQVLRFCHVDHCWLIASSSRMHVRSEVVAGRLHVTFVAGLAGSLDLATIIACRCARFVRIGSPSPSPGALVSHVVAAHL